MLPLGTLGIVYACTVPFGQGQLKCKTMRFKIQQNEID